jgi:hypothetical protein
MARMGIDPMPPRLLSPFVHDVMLPIVCTPQGRFRRIPQKSMPSTPYSRRKPAGDEERRKTVKTPKTATVSVALASAALVLAPTAAARMTAGNYVLQTPRDPGHSWIWSVRPCAADSAVPTSDCIHVDALPRPNGQAAPWNTDANLANGRYTMAVDVPDGVRCTVYFLPSHDTYSWDAVTLAGSVDSTFDAGCGGAPGGTVNYPFSLVRY